MSYSLERLPDGEYRLEIGGGAVCFTASVFRRIADSIYSYEHKASEKRRAESEAIRDARIKAAGVGGGLPWNSIYREAIADERITPYLLESIKDGLLSPNGSLLWSAYFSKIDWDADGYLFEPALQRRWGGGVEAVLAIERSESPIYRAMQQLSEVDIDTINKKSSQNTNLIIVGMTESRDYTSFASACRVVYGTDPGIYIQHADIAFARANFGVMVDALYDAAVFVAHNSGRYRAICPGLEHNDTMAQLEEVCRVVMYVSRFFTDEDWAKVTQSPIWLLVKDMVSVRKASRNLAA